MTATSSRPRTKCPKCRRWCAVKKDGSLYGHNCERRLHDWECHLHWRNGRACRHGKKEVVNRAA